MIEHILVSDIRKHLDRNKILVDEQHGFRPKRVPTAFIYAISIRQDGEEKVDAFLTSVRFLTRSLIAV